MKLSKDLTLEDALYCHNVMFEKNDKTDEENHTTMRAFIKKVPTEALPGKVYGFLSNQGYFGGDVECIC